MLNRCPKEKSCGTRYPVWTDATAPTEVSVVTAATAYKVYYGDCKHELYPIEIMRCSEIPNDIVYKQVKYDSSRCVTAFCGMQ